jgi:hypothetical protein
MARRPPSSLRRERTSDIIYTPLGTSIQGHHDESAEVDPSSEEGDKSFKVYPSSLSNGGGYSRGAGAKTTSSARSNSVALSEAEGGTFKATAPLLDPAHAHSPRFAAASSFPSASRIGMPSILRNWSAKRVLFALVVGFVFFTFILSPTNQRKKVLSKANKAWEEGLDLAEDYWDGMRKPEVPLSPADKSIDFSAQAPKPADEKVPDQEPHVINLPPMTAGDKVKDSSILDAVRKKPALHPDREKTTRCESNGGKVLDWRGQSRPVVQYAIMIDAGSTGSRVHVYKVGERKNDILIIH